MGEGFADLNGNISCRKSKKKGTGRENKQMDNQLCFSARGDENGKDEKQRGGGIQFSCEKVKEMRKNIVCSKGTEQILYEMSC